MKVPIEKATLPLKTGVLRLFLAVLVFLIPILHYSSTTHIPIFYIFDPVQAASSRENYSKLATYPYLLKILPNFYFTIIAPLALALFFRLGNKKTFLVLLAWVSFYALSSTAEFVVVIFLTMTIFAVRTTGGIKNYRYMEIFAVICMLSIIFSGLLVASKLNSNPTICESRVEQYRANADKYRVCREADITLVNPLVDKVAYRVFFTPIDVSKWWYKYYNDYSQRSFGSIFDRNLKSQPSNIIGKIAYFDRFPDSYLGSVSANSSIDADSYSFGWIFVWLSGFALLIIRMASALGLGSKTFILRSLGAILFSGLILFPFTSSIQALLVAQGMVIPSVYLCISIIRERLLLMISS